MVEIISPGNLHHTMNRTTDREQGMESSCRKRIYLQKQGGLRTRYVTQENMIRDLDEKSPFFRDADILLACLNCYMMGWRYIGDGVTEEDDVWVGEDVKFIDYDIPLIPHHPTAGGGTSILKVSLTQMLELKGIAEKRLLANPVYNDDGEIAYYRFSHDGALYEVSRLGMLVFGAGLMHTKGLDSKTWREWYCKRIDQNETPTEKDNITK